METYQRCNDCMAIFLDEEVQCPNCGRDDCLMDDIDPVACYETMRQEVARLTAELEAEKHAHEIDRHAYGDIKERWEAARAEAAGLREALPDSDLLVLLADWIDSKYPNDKNPEVQSDLRKWASNIRAALERTP